MAAVTLYVLHWIVTLAALVVAWRAGGSPERQAATVLLMAYLVSVPAGMISIDVVVAVDVALAVGLVGLSMVHRRWWLLFVSANAIIVVVAHWSVLLDTEIFRRAYISYRMAPNLLITAAVMVSPLERWMAGGRSTVTLRSLAR